MPRPSVVGVVGVLSHRGSTMNRLAAGLVLSATFAVAVAATGPAPAPAQDKKGDTKTPALPLDLTKYYRTPASQFDKSKTYPWRIVPRGSKTFGNVPLAIDGQICLWGEGNAKNGLVFPEAVDDIPVNRKFDTLYVYHATFFASREGSPVYHLTLKYADDTTSMTTICYGAHVRDWYKPAKEKVTRLSDSKSSMVWSAEHPDNKAITIRFFITPVTNPRPAREVKSISLASAKGNSAACILAMTTGPDDLFKPEDPDAK
jgi:hypothetical protein